MKIARIVPAPFCLLLLATLLLVTGLLVTLGAHDIITTNLTYTRDVAPILARRCQSCHSAANSIALTTYEETRPWAVAIKEQVLSRQMPPWGAVKGFGHLSPDHGLTQEEMMILAAWVVGGAPKGNPVFLAAAQQLKAPLKDGPPLRDALIVNDKIRIEKAMMAAGIRPITSGTIDSTRIIVRLPNGHVEPLLWLFHYNSTWNSVFQFRETVSLPAGSVVEAGAPLKFALETKQF